MNQPTELASKEMIDQTKSINLFGMKIDSLRLEEATSRVLSWCFDPQDRDPQDLESRDSESRGCRYVVTPNVDHAVMFQHHEGLRKSYQEAAMVVADGAPLIAVSKLLGKALPERVAGSDLGPQVIAQASSQVTAGKGQPLKLFLLGAGPGVADRAAAKITQQFPGIEIVGTYCPPLGFEKDELENQRTVEAVNAAKPDLLLVGLGAPKQELWVHQHHQQLDAKVALCIGATIDFLAGEKKRSPEWMQQLGLEWAHRLLSEPRRLAGRYARDAWIFPQLVWGEFRGFYRN